MNFGATLKQQQDKVEIQAWNSYIKIQHKI